MRTRKKGRWEQKEVLCCATLGILTIGLCLLLCGTDRVFGSKVDWISQHSVIADYFRQQFYDTGELFPEFAANLGGGQNIYNFAYYGLDSPVILVSYLFPFVKMGDYLMGASVVLLGSAVILLYCWLRARRFSRKIAFGTAVMFLLAGPMIFHSYNHVMFVNYVPFLCMGLWGIDRYFEKKKGVLFTVSTFLMIMTSFYFSICGILVLVLYGLHRYFHVESLRGTRVTIRGFLKDGICFGMHLLVAVMMSGVLLVPAALALSGRGGARGGTDLAELLCPGMEIWRFVYSGYGIGLTTLVITVLISGLFYKKLYERVLAYGTVIVLIFPVFSWALNGGLYIRDKALIPFLPLLCYMIAYYLDKMEKGEISFLRGILSCFLTLVLLYPGRESAGNSRYWSLILADGAIMSVCILVFYRKKKVGFLVIPPIAFLLVFAGAYHSGAYRMLDKEFYEEITEAEIGEAMEKVLEEDRGFYRMEQLGTGTENAANLNRIWSMGQYVSSVYSSSYHADYADFRQNVFETEEPLRNFLMQPVSRNPLFQKFMGVKYLIVNADGEDAEKGIPGYELYDWTGNVEIYRNENVSPVIYGTDRVISEKIYQGLEFPYNQLALMDHAVAENGNAYRDSSVPEKVYPADFMLPEMEEEGSTIEKTDAGYHIKMKNREGVSVSLGTDKVPEESCILFLQFKVRNHKPSNDVGIWVEREKNTLCAENHLYYNGNTTFTYAVLLKPGQKEAAVDLNKGDYEILEIQSCLFSWSEQISRKYSQSLYQSEFVPDKTLTKGNRIVGNIDMKKDGFLITTIPYEENFRVLADGEEVSCEKVNTAFLGLTLKAGAHSIEIIYRAPGLQVGKMLSIAGILMFAGICIKESFAARCR